MFGLFKKQVNRFARLSTLNVCLVVLSKFLCGLGAGILLLHYVPETPIYVAWGLIIVAVLISIPGKCKMWNICKK